VDFIEILKDINGRFEKAMKNYNNPSTGRPREAHGGGPPDQPEEPETYEEYKASRACKDAERIRQAHDAAEQKRKQ